MDLRLSVRFLIITVISPYNSRILLASCSLVACRNNYDSSIFNVIIFLSVWARIDFALSNSPYKIIEWA
jgi:hypothetical protein